MKRVFFFVLRICFNISSFVIIVFLVFVGVEYIKFFLKKYEYNDEMWFFVV